MSDKYNLTNAQFAGGFTEAVKGDRENFTEELADVI